MLFCSLPLYCFVHFCLFNPFTSHAICTAAKECFRYCRSKYENLPAYFVVINGPPLCKISVRDRQMLILQPEHTTAVA